MDAPEGTEIILEGVNGAVFHISGGDREGEEGVKLLSNELGTAFEDMYETPVETIYNSTAFEIGGRYGGLREKMFEFSLAFIVRATPQRQWRINDSRFRKALSYKKDAKLRVIIPGVSERWLTVRLRSNIKLKVSTNPNERRYGLILVPLVAAYPRWVEDDCTDTYTATTDTRPLAAPTLNTPTTATTGGTLAAATYYYKVTTLTSLGESTGSNEKSIATTGSTSKNTLTWSAVTGATGYRVYRSTSSGTEKLLATLGTVTTYADSGATVGTATVPTTNTAEVADEVGSVWVQNPTDTETWLKWVLQAGTEGIIWTLPDFSWGDDRFDRADDDSDRMIELPTLHLNEHIVVDTDEMTMAGQVVSSLDTQVYQRMNGREFLYPIPPYTDPIQVPVAVRGAEVGNLVQVRCPRTWSRPWGLE
ncbi:hypothetical protein [Nocardia nova]|uniref:hypothetical protein n=1 Tax=Nocardia nova TaxID=37330 RepID=UPI00273A0768|nr:hypothetical protein [Nocardia nova]